MKLTVKDIMDITGGKLVCGNESTICEGFSKDTRTIKNGDLYFGLRGDNYDGNKFYKEAFLKGASICILDNKDEIDSKENTIILVKDTMKSLWDLANYARDKINVPIISITGSVGKTTTKDMVASVLETSYTVLKTEGSNNNHIGLPLTLLRYNNEEIVVIEMGMNNFGELSFLTNILKPTIGIITNIGTAHIGNLGSRKNILKAKLEMLEGMEKGSTLIINNDNDLLHEYYLANKSKCKIITIGINNPSMYQAFKIKNDLSGFDVKGICKNVNNKYCTLPFILNSLIAFAAGKEFNMKDAQIKKGIKDFELSKNRLEIIKTSNIMVIDDTFNANYDSVKTALEYLSNLKGKRKIALLGDMLELGKYSKKIHKSVGESIVDNKIDVLVTVGENSLYINDGAIKKGFNFNNSYHFDNNEEMIKFLDNYLKKDDILLIKASKMMHFNEVAQYYRNRK